MPTRPTDRGVDDYNVAVIFAMEFEMSAFRYMLDEEYCDIGKHLHDSNEYVLGEMAGHNVVLVWLAEEQGIGAAAIASADLSRTFPAIEWRLLVGIGGGVVRTRDIRLGDVVVSMSTEMNGGVVQYDLGRETDHGFTRKGFLDAPPKYLRAAVGKMQSSHRLPGNKIAKCVAELVARGGKLDESNDPASPTCYSPMRSLTTPLNSLATIATSLLLRSDLLERMATSRRYTTASSPRATR